jgi:hypothetical protein
MDYFWIDVMLYVYMYAITLSSIHPPEGVSWDRELGRRRILMAMVMDKASSI